MLAVRSIRYAMMKLTTWKPPKPTANPITIFFGNESLFHQDRVFFEGVAHDAQ